MKTICAIKSGHFFRDGSVTHVIAGSVTHAVSDVSRAEKFLKKLYPDVEKSDPDDPFFFEDKKSRTWFKIIELPLILDGNE